ncbi:MAG: Holliday junction resolvase RuvX [Acidimicrobiaceae bacterium]|nr:Holliday junction resolvase RuvX [Acidimicrobiaceae bacterium]
MRTVALDMGDKRIGIAVSDSNGLLAVPSRVFKRGSDRLGDLRKLASELAEYDAMTVVVGLPLSLSGEIGPKAMMVLEEIELLRAELPNLAVVTHDERMSTISASRALFDAGRSSRSLRQVVDASSAAIILQSWLDANRN